MLRDTSATTSSQGSSSTGTTALQKKNDALGKTEFLNLLVTQLKNQDPMEPMKNDQFAVNLAQFSQLEQLIGINDKIGNSSADLNSMAAYLGHEVTLNTDTIDVKNHSGGSIKFNLPSDASALRIELTDPVTGSVQESIDVGALAAGKHSVSLANLETSKGSFKVKVTAVGQIGGQFNVPVNASGVVNGFVPGPEPKLLTADGMEIDPANVIEVSVPQH